MTDPAATFSPAQVESLVAAIAVHDEIDLAATLPTVITLDYDGGLLDRCYRLSYRLWEEVDHARLVALASRLARHGDLTGADARAFKDIRARAKQLRFAYATLSAGHRYPPVLDHLTRFMGHAQDAMKSGRGMGAAARGILLRAMLSAVPTARMARELRAFTVTSPSGLRDHILSELDDVEKVLALPAITNAMFHDTRKIVSRLVALYDTFTVLAPSDHHTAVARYLGTINGLMGTMHDEMVLRRAVSRRAYRHAAEPLPSAVAERLTALVASFMAAPRAGADS